MSRPITRVDLATRDIAEVAAFIRDAVGDDDRAFLDTLEGETDLHAIVRLVLDSIEQDEGDVVALAAQIEVRKQRQERCEQRIEVKRRSLVRLLDAAGLSKLPLPEVTLSVRDVPAKLTVLDPAAVPDELTVVTRRPSMAAINAVYADADAEVTPNWLNRTEARRSLSLRRK